MVPARRLGGQPTPSARRRPPGEAPAVRLRFHGHLQGLRHPGHRARGARRADAADRIGGAAARFSAVRRLAVGRDARATSPELCDALVRGIADGGSRRGRPRPRGDAHALLRGRPPRNRGRGHGDGLAQSRRVQRLQALRPARGPGRWRGHRTARDRAGSRARRRSPRTRPGQLRRDDVRDAYVEHLLDLLDADGRRSGSRSTAATAWPGSGSSRSSSDCRSTAKRLYFEPDGHLPEPPGGPARSGEPARTSADAVRRTGADFGVAFDGDGDRAIFVDERGEPVSSDLVTVLLRAPMLQRHPGGTRPLRPALEPRVRRRRSGRPGGVAEMCRVGHSFVKAQMRESGAVFAGELSGHFYFRFSDTLVADDGSAAFVALLEYCARSGARSRSSWLRSGATPRAARSTAESPDAGRLSPRRSRPSISAAEHLAPRRAPRALPRLVVQPAPVEHGARRAT